jgi:two-component system response regulator
VTAPAPLEVLLVEDNPRDAELTLRAFQKYRLASHVLVAQDGAEALALLHPRPDGGGAPVERPRLILLDLKLPKVGGLEVLRQLKSDDHTRAIPVVVVTSSNQDRDIRDAYAFGANSYVVKPVEFDAFTATIRDLGAYWLVVNQVTK